jgi:hypothetical protein
VISVIDMAKAAAALIDRDRRADGALESAPHFHELRPVALNVFTARVMALVNGNLPRLALGFTLGPTDVGLFALGSRFLDIIVNTTALPWSAVGRIELRAAKIGSAEFRRDLATMVQLFLLLILLHA